jgi:hypothetical protein
MVWGRGFGWGLRAGFLGGVIIGGALASPYYYRPYYIMARPTICRPLMAQVIIQRRFIEAAHLTAPAVTNPTIPQQVRSSAMTACAIPALERITSNTKAAGGWPFTYGLCACLLRDAGAHCLEGGLVASSRP